MYKKALTFIAAAVFVFFFAGCTARASLSLNTDKSAALIFKTEPGKTIEQTLTAFTGTDENKTLFDNEKVRNAFEKTGFGLHSLSFSGKTGISLHARTADIGKTDTGGALTFESDGTSEMLTIKLTPETLNGLLKLLPPETAEYTELLMAPVFTGETLSEEEYARIIGNMYGDTVKRELETSFFIFDISAPADIVSASLFPAETGKVSKNGKTASFQIFLNKFLSDSGKTIIRIQWKS